MKSSVKKTNSDVYARIQSGSTAGRGSIAGWTPCPLCCGSPFNADATFMSHEPPKQRLLTSIPSNQSILNTLSNLKHLKSTKSTKLFSHGRGLAAHLHAVHTPWNPAKAELKRRQGLKRRWENERKRMQRLHNQAEDCGSDGERAVKRAKLNHVESMSNVGDDEVAWPSRWDPSADEVNMWNQRVMEIVNLVEMESKSENDAAKSSQSGEDSKTPSQLYDGPGNTASTSVGTDRSGKLCPSYRESLPPFLAAAADGDIIVLRQCVSARGEEENDNSSHFNDKTINNAHAEDRRILLIKDLISCRDRNGSTAEHWAAGGGHIECLSYLLELRDMVSASEPKQSVTDTSDKSTVNGKVDDSNANDSSNNQSKLHTKIRRRRDGKTSLHYASRNGHTSCIKLLLSRPDAPSVNIRSGDGTTPLHLACYGGHPSTVRMLVEAGADVFATNDWECGCAHWTSMSLGNEGIDSVLEICEYLKGRGLDFCKIQRQGHSPLHKAASKRNRRVVEWLAGRSLDGEDMGERFTEEERKKMGEPDKCGNAPSDIWLSVGGDVEFASWMKESIGW